jgi:hypothetical protein
MKFMQRWIAKKLKWYWENHDRLVHGYEQDSDMVYPTTSGPSPMGSSKPRFSGNVTRADSQLRGNPVEMKIHMANGGYVIEFYRYDAAKDHSSIETYVIDDNVDKLGENIAQIVVQYTIQNR